MSLIKKGRYWHFDFTRRGVRHQGSTGQTNINKARLVEAKLKSDAALDGFGLLPRDAPIFGDFLEGAFLRHVERYAARKNTEIFYRTRVNRLLKHPPFRKLRVSEIDEAVITTYLATRKAAVATLNADLTTIRKALGLAYEQRLIQRRPRLRAVPGSSRREFIVSRDLEAAYLALTNYPLHHAAVLMLDLGLRPEECMRLKREDITDDSLIVQSGKTKRSRRALPLTTRAAEAVVFLLELHVDGDWLFPSPKLKGKHLGRPALDWQHLKVRRQHQMPDEFVLYSFRHTFATRLDESGARPFEIQAALGHATISTTQKYVHLSDDHVRLALKRKEAMDRLMRGEVHEETSTVESRRGS